jgi:molybdate transport system permease protein
VTLPLAKDGLIASSILTWAKAMGEFGATVTLAGATAFKTETLPINIFLSLSTADVEKAVAAIFILIVIATVSLIALRKISGKKYPI